MRKIAPLLLLLITVAACSSIDCPLNKTVYAVYELSGEVTSLSDELTISTKRHDNTDTVLLNRSVNTTSFELPMSYAGTEDMLILTMVDAENVTRTDTLFVGKRSVPHFESVECSPVYFHTLTGIRHTTHAIASVTVNQPLVSYDTSETNIYISFKPRD